MSNSFGHLFKITTFGESHGLAVGVVVDGCPPGLDLDREDIQLCLDRRRPGQSDCTTQRLENDTVELLSGVYAGKTIGTPIMMLVRNKDVKLQDYEGMKHLFRPSHGDYTYFKKYGVPPLPGGGRASARETLARVAAGAVAQKILKHFCAVEILAYVERIGTVGMQKKCIESLSRPIIESSPVRCPDQLVSQNMIEAIKKIKEQGDSLGGTVVCVINNVPAGWGEPVFDKLEADLAKAMLSIPAAKAFEIGSGFEGTFLKGSEHNDSFVIEKENVRTQTNYSGGIQAGISNGQQIYFRVGFKPVASVAMRQDTIDIKGRPSTITVQGRHDPCVLPRAVPIVEAMAACVLADHFVLSCAQKTIP